ncbi:MAG: hypothetical protein HY707_08100 [Ignavibacteriae bacterium]|nr:hypothetical protein [Ignavibacteriota bacterium]
MNLQQYYWQQIREKVCTQCMHGDAKGNCSLSTTEECALKVYLPEIISVVANAHTDSYERQLYKLRRHVCILCDWQMPDMTCQKRTEGTCALERYYPIIIEIIKDARKKLQNAEVDSAFT